MAKNNLIVLLQDDAPVLLRQTAIAILAMSLFTLGCSQGPVSKETL